MSGRKVTRRTSSGVVSRRPILRTLTYGFGHGRAFPLSLLTRTLRGMHGLSLIRQLTLVGSLASQVDRVTYLVIGSTKATLDTSIPFSMFSVVDCPGTCDAILRMAYRHG